MAKEKAKHDGLLCFLLALIVVLILVIGGGAYYFLVVDNGEESSDIAEISNNIISNTSKTQEPLDINDKMVEQLHGFIPTVEYNDFFSTAYQTSKITFNDLNNQVKLINVFNKIDFDKEQTEIDIGDNTVNMLDNWFSFSEEVMERKVKEIYGKDANLKNESFDLRWGAGCNYENGKYKYSYGGGGTSLDPITYITKAYIDDDELYIYDKFLVAREVEEINYLGGDEYYVYNTTVSKPIDKIIDEKICSFTNDEFEQFFLDKYKDYMTEYKHTFKKNESGDYYWYSTEPVDIKQTESNITKYNKVDTVKYLYTKNLKEKNDSTKHELLDFEVDEVNIIEGNERTELIKNFYPEAKDTDIFAVVVYSVLPSDINKTNWIAGNGEIEDRWIKNKTACVYIAEENGQYTIKGDGTSW